MCLQASTKQSLSKKFQKFYIDVESSLRDKKFWIQEFYFKLNVLIAAVVDPNTRLVAFAKIVAY